MADEPPMQVDDGFQRWGRYACAAVLAGVVGWFAFVRHTEVPILDLFDLGIHEVGHLLMAFTPQMLMFVAGSAAQVLVPLGLAWYFGIHRRDLAGGGFCLSWAGASLWDVSVYVADAPVQALPLIGGGQHDWAYLLGSQGWGVMHLADEIARVIEVTGAVLALAGMAVAAGAAVAGAVRREVVVSQPVTVLPSAVDEPDPWLAAADLPFRYRPAVGE